jgi:hypothetical protein
MRSDSQKFINCRTVVNGFGRKAPLKCVTNVQKLRVRVLFKLISSVIRF